MKERLLNILDQSTCLTRRQMKDYLAGTMLPEEVHAAETHIASCPLCSMALEGFETNNEEALAAIASLNSGFLKDHFDSITPQIHLNSMTPAVPVAHHPHHHTKKKKTQTYSLLKVAAVAAALVIGFGVFWLIDHRGNKIQDAGRIAQNEEVAVPAAAAPPVMSSDQAPAPQKNSVAQKQPLVNKTTATSSSDAVEEVAVTRESAPVSEDAAVPAISDAGTRVIARNKPAAAPATGYRRDSVSYQSRDGGNVQLGGARAPYGNSYVVDQNAASEAKEQNQPAGKADSKMTTYRWSDDRKKAADTVAMPAPKAVIAAKRSVAAEPVEKVKDKEAEAGIEEAPLRKGDELYGKGNYKAALTKYNAAMKSGNRRQRAEATLMAAKCYRNMGNKTKAISLLQNMVDNGGPQKRAARRMLDELTGGK